MNVRVRLFAGTREAAGAAEVLVKVEDGASVDETVDALLLAYPRLAPYRPHARVALDGAFALPTARVHDGATLAFMPPVSGGSGALVPEGPLAPPALRPRGGGAVVTFVGHVREDPTAAHGKVTRLLFEAYEPMAEAAIAELCDEATRKFALLDCQVRHRVGDVLPGEPIVAVAVAARHRREAFEACAYVMDALKSRVPLWKQEHAADGSAAWVNDPTTTGAE